MLADKNQILELIPQKSPMVMVDALLSYNSSKTVSELQLTKTNIFCDSGFFQEAGLIENMAQTAALRSGYEAKLSGNHPKTGYIGTLKKVDIFELPKDNDVINTSVYVKHELMNALVIKAEVHVNEKMLAEGEMNIFLQDET